VKNPKNILGQGKKKKRKNPDLVTYHILARQ
jgi:hypothetical protein